MRSDRTDPLNLVEHWRRLRAGGPQQLAATLTLFVASFFLLPSSKAVNNIYYALVLAPGLFLLRGSDWRWLARSGLWRAAMALLIYLTLSGLWTEHARLVDWLSQAKALPYLGVYLALVACVGARRPRAAGWLVRAFVLATAAGTVISAVVFYSHAPWPARLVYAGAVYNANEGATVAGTALLLALFGVIPASAPGWRKGAWLATAAALLVGMILSGSRTPLTAVIVSILIGLVLGRRWRLLGVAVALLGLALTLLTTVSAGRQALGRGDSYRLAIWQYYAARAAQHPWLGEGVLTDDASRVEFHGADGTAFHALHAHDVYLATTLYGGLPALLLMLTVIALALRQGWAQAQRGEPAWLLALVFALLCMLTDGDRLLHAPRGIWVYFWLPIGALVGLQARWRGLGEAAQEPGRAAWPATLDGRE